MTIFGPICSFFCLSNLILRDTNSAVCVSGRFFRRVFCRKVVFFVILVLRAGNYVLLSSATDML